MIIEDIKYIKDIENILPYFKGYGCVVILCKYNGGKSSIATELIHQWFGEENTYYVTFTDQSKPNFIPRKSRLEFNELVNNKVIVFDEIDSDKRLDLKEYLKRLIQNNLVVILSNFYGNSQDYEKEVKLFQNHEEDILPENTLFIFVRS